MTITQQDLTLRSATVADAPQLNAWWNDGAVMAHAGFPNGLGEALDTTVENIKAGVGKLSQLCIIEVEGVPVGECSYRVHGDGTVTAGWKLCNPAYQNKGVGPRVIRLLLRFLFTDEAINTRFPTRKVVWDTALDNTRAQHVYEQKIGATRLHVKENAWQDQLGRWRDAVYYEITRDAFMAREEQAQ